MNKDEIKKALECCSNPNTGSCKDCPYNYNDEFHCAYGEMCKDALNLINEQETEIEQLKAETSNIRKEMAREILDMLYDMGIDKGMLECCRICDVNGVSLAKQICEKYGVGVEK